MRLMCASNKEQMQSVVAWTVSTTTPITTADEHCHICWPTQHQLPSPRHSNFKKELDLQHTQPQALNYSNYKSQPPVRDVHGDYTDTPTSTLYPVNLTPTRPKSYAPQTQLHHAKYSMI